jgi:thioredoxin reductase (NADPH)
MSAESPRHAPDSRPRVDAVVIGAGPAGLMAAIYLGRFRRRSMVLDGGQSRARWIPKSHNIPGFDKGIGGTALLEGLTTQALAHGAQITRGVAEAVTLTADGFAVRTSAAVLEARFVLLATGIVDALPDVPGVGEALHSGLLRLCPICDAYEAIDRQIAVIGRGPHAEREARFLQTYSGHVSLVQLVQNGASGTGAQPPPLGIEVLEASPASLHFEDQRLQVVLADGSLRSFDVVYAALGCRPQSALAAALGAHRDDNDALLVSAHQETSVPGLYAAGDLVRGLSQVVVACAEAAIAATHMHNRLRTAPQPSEG